MSKNEDKSCYEISEDLFRELESCYEDKLPRYEPSAFELGKMVGAREVIDKILLLTKYQAKLANQQLEQGLIDKENEKNEALENVNQAVNTDPIKSGDITNTSLTPKRTISTLALPFKNGGLNVR